VVTTADSGGDDGGQAHELVDEVVHAVGEAHNLVGADGVGEHGQPIHPMYPADEHHVAALRQPGAGAGGGGLVADEHQRGAGISMAGRIGAGCHIELEGEPGGEVDDLVEQRGIVGYEQWSVH